MTESQRAIKSKSTRLYVAAIDFGTTYSGFAFSPKSNWETIIVNHWNSGKFVSHKAPTTLLLTPEKKFHSFGYDAENAYMEMAEEDSDNEDDDSDTAKKCDKYYYFHRFKMILYNDISLNRNTKCTDWTGKKEIEAMKVFMYSIQYLKDEVIRTMNEQMSTDIYLSDVDFVLTVPAIWGDSSKMFMREAATKAGIPSDQLLIALEPEAASIYCQHLHMEKQDNHDSSFLNQVTKQTKYMVVDLGGGTVDITVHRKADNGTLEELLPASGGPVGGTSVDEEFIKFFQEIAGDDIFKEFTDTSLEDHLEFLRQFEMKKRSISETKVRIIIPLSFDRLLKKKGGLAKLIEKTDYKDKVEYDSTKKLIMKPEFFKSFFKKTVDSIVNYVDGIFTDNDFNDVNTVVLVGGFSECDLIRKALMEKFNKKRFIVPEEAGLAVVKGAVYFGHIPSAITRRVSRYTYGIQSWPAFDTATHPISKKVQVRDSFRCKDVFFPFVTKGEQIEVGLRKSQVFKALNPEQSFLECAIYISNQKDPKYTDQEGIRRLGVLKIPLPNTASEIVETIIFGETEIKVQAQEIGTGRTFEASFDLLAPPE